MEPQGSGCRKLREKKAVGSTPRRDRKGLNPQTFRHTPEADFGNPREEWPATFVQTMKTEPLRSLSSKPQRLRLSVHSHV